MHYRSIYCVYVFQLSSSNSFYYHRKKIDSFFPFPHNFCHWPFDLRLAIRHFSSHWPTQIPQETLYYGRRSKKCIPRKKTRDIKEIPEERIYNIYFEFFRFHILYVRYILPWICEAALQNYFWCKRRYFLCIPQKVRYFLIQYIEFE